MKRLFMFSVFTILALLLAACAPAATPVPTATPTEAPPPTEAPTEEPASEPMSIVDIAVADGRFTTLTTALTEAGLVETLNGEGPFTVFAPTDEAFNQLPDGTLESLLADIPALENVLLYHVAAGEMLAADVLSMDSLTMLSGDEAIVSMDGETPMIDDAAIIITDIQASNGVIHVIDAVITPDSAMGETDQGGEMGAESLPSIVDIATGDENFSTLVTALTEAGLVDALSGDGPYTVFAPTNAAFDALPEGALDELLADQEALTQVLLYHVVDGKAMAEDVVGLPYAETLAEQPVLFTVDDGTVMVNEATVTTADVEATNGVVHVIDAVLLPPTMDIVETAIDAGNFTTLVTAIEASGLVETLQGEGPFTVFAPTDEAFALLPEGTIENLLNDIPALTDILLYHVVEGRVLSADVIELDTATTVNDLELMISVNEDGSVMINDAMVVVTDILATNGVIHVIDAVLLP